MPIQIWYIITVAHDNIEIGRAELFFGMAFPWFFCKKDKRKKHLPLKASAFFKSPSDWNRTSGLLNPIQARYQSAPHPDNNRYYYSKHFWIFQLLFLTKNYYIFSLKLCKTAIFNKNCGFVYFYSQPALTFTPISSAVVSSCKISPLPRVSEAVFESSWERETAFKCYVKAFFESGVLGVESGVVFWHSKQPKLHSPLSTLHSNLRPPL